MFYHEKFDMFWHELVAKTWHVSTRFVGKKSGKQLKFWIRWKALKKTEKLLKRSQQSWMSLKRLLENVKKLLTSLDKIWSLEKSGMSWNVSESLENVLKKENVWLAV